MYFLKEYPNFSRVLYILILYIHVHTYSLGIHSICTIARMYVCMQRYSSPVNRL